MTSPQVKIGLETHVQLTSLRSKLFCGCSADYRDAPPNTHVCPVCLGIPGSLPVLNRRAIDDAIMVALALNSEVQRRTLFYRKNYYYPDMPKNFQISQYDKAGGVPLAVGGDITVQVDHAKRVVRVRRIQLEEDPGRLIHLGPIDASPYTLVDYNRSGIALLEIVTEPDLRSPKEARAFLQKLRSILEHLGVSDGGLEGAMRCDANISLAEGKRVEVKNISSFKEVERALNFETVRQRSLIAKGLGVEMETRHWDEARRVTITLRAKEEEHDYRYFPEPDLVPIVISEGQIREIGERMPELPDVRRGRFIKQYGLPPYDAGVLTGDKALADFFEECTELYPDAKRVSNWMMTDLLRSLHEQGLEIGEAEITPQHLAETIRLIDEGTISGKIAKKILPEVVRTGKPPAVVVEEMGLTRIASRERVEELAERVFKEFPKAVQDALTDEEAVHYLVGQVMRLTKGRADPQLTNQVIREKIVRIRESRVRY
ncbi:MAG: Asp-tRNA(Asn)/Glu-tRNA(Gln) amidotransferase subunit GatB [Candidatus Bathyarchaeia archaeon]